LDSTIQNSPITPMRLGSMCSKQAPCFRSPSSILDISTVVPPIGGGVDPITTRSARNTSLLLDRLNKSVPHPARGELGTRKSRCALTHPIQLLIVKPFHPQQRIA